MEFPSKIQQVERSFAENIDELFIPEGIVFLFF